VGIELGKSLGPVEGELVGVTVGMELGTSLGKVVGEFVG